MECVITEATLHRAQQGPTHLMQADTAGGGEVEEDGRSAKEIQGTHTYIQNLLTHLNGLSISCLFFFPLEYICCYTSGVLSEKDKSVYQQIRSLPRWSNYRYLRQRGSRRTGPLGIGWQSQIRLYLYLHTVGRTSPIPCTELKERNLGHFIH